MSYWRKLLQALPECLPLFALVLAGACVSNPVHAQAVPAQWTYKVTANNNSLATYPGDIQVNGVATFNGTTNITNLGPLNITNAASTSLIDVGTGSQPALWLRTNLTSAWPGLLIENTARNANAQTQLFWKRWDAGGNPLVWQVVVDVDNNGGFKGLFNMEAIDINAGTVIATPISMSRAGEVGISTGVPEVGTTLKIGGDTRIRRSGGTAVDGALLLGSNQNVQLYGNSTAQLLSIYTNASEVARFIGTNLLIGTTTDNGQRLQVNGTTLTAALQLTPIAVASLPACTGREGSLYAVTDANSAVFHAAAVGGGTNHMLAYCDGTNWTIH